MGTRMNGRTSNLQQRGSILLFTAIGLSLLVAMLAVVDVGFTYHYKREYQKAADLAALSGVKRLISRVDASRDCGLADAAAQSNAGLNIHDDSDLAPLQCGLWEPSRGPAPSCTAGSADPRLDGSDPSQANAVRAVVTGTPPSWFLPARAQSACAIALTDAQPLAQLTIRSTLATLSTEQSSLLNGVVGGLLGGSIDLDAASWNGLLNTDINLLQYLDALAFELGTDLGDYDQVLAAEVTLGQLLAVAADALNQGGNTAEANAALGLNQLLESGLSGLSPPLPLGELIGAGTGLPGSAFDLDLNLLDLVQGGAMLATGDSVATIDLPVVGIPGVATVAARIKVMEPPMPSAAGNPQLAKDDPFGPDRIFVRTAQLRTLIDIDIGGVTDLVDDLDYVANQLIGPVVSFLDSTVLSNGLDLISTVGSLLEGLDDLILKLGCALGCATSWEEKDIVYVEALNEPLQISLDAAGASAYVSDYNCLEGKSLDVPAQTSLAHLRIGRMTAASVFASGEVPVVSPVPLIEIGYKEVRARRTCGILFSNCKNTEQWRQPGNGGWSEDKHGKATARKTVIAGLGLKVDAPVGQSPNPPTLVYMSPQLPEIGEEPAYQQLATEQLVSSLRTTLQNVTIQPYHSNASGLLGGLLSGTFSLLGGVTSGLQGVLDPVLADALDPLLDGLLPALGIDLAAADVGANLSCDAGSAMLVD